MPNMETYFIPMLQSSTCISQTIFYCTLIDEAHPDAFVTLVWDTCVTHFIYCTCNSYMYNIFGEHRNVQRKCVIQSIQYFTCITCDTCVADTCLIHMFYICNNAKHIHVWQAWYNWSHNGNGYVGTPTIKLHYILKLINYKIFFKIYTNPIIKNMLHFDLWYIVFIRLGFISLNIMLLHAIKIILYATKCNMII